MARFLGEMVHYTPHNDHTFLHVRAADGTVQEYAAVVGELHADGSADLLVFVPNREPIWMDDVPEGDSHHTHRSIDAPPTAPAAGVQGGVEAATIVPAPAAAPVAVPTPPVGVAAAAQPEPAPPINPAAPRQ